MKLDHFFVLTDPGALAAERLTDLGLAEGPPNEHPGQGTANRRFFFSNSALELLYIRDAVEATSGEAERLQLKHRAERAAACPFGFVLRGEVKPCVAPFDSWPYAPRYLPEGKHFLVGDNSELLAEPLCIVMPHDLPPRPTGPVAPHFSTVTRLTLHTPLTKPSSTLSTVLKFAGVSLRTDSEHLLEVVFNDGNAGRRNDLRPHLPLQISW